LILKNWTKTKQNIVEITKRNEKHLRTKYEARTAYELPVLRRYFPVGSVRAKKEKFLNIILYSKE